MSQFFFYHLHFAFFHHLHFALFCALLFARLTDIGTTYLASPKLKLEANPVVRRLGWWYAWATLLIAFIAYVYPALAVAALVASLMVSASNAKFIWVSRTIGEEELHSFNVRAAVRAKPALAVASMLMSSFFIALLAAVMFLFYPNPNHDWGYWLAYGVMAYAIIGAIYNPLAFFRARRSFSAMEAEVKAATNPKAA
jgi:hypothetical protein